MEGEILRSSLTSCPAIIQDIPEILTRPETWYTRRCCVSLQRLRTRYKFFATASRDAQTQKLYSPLVSISHQSSLTSGLRMQISLRGVEVAEFSARFLLHPGYFHAKFRDAKIFLDKITSLRYCTARAEVSSNVSSNTYGVRYIIAN